MAGQPVLLDPHFLYRTPARKEAVEPLADLPTAMKTVISGKDREEKKGPDSDPLPLKYPSAAVGKLEKGKEKGKNYAEPYLNQTSIYIISTCDSSGGGGKEKEANRGILSPPLLEQ